MNRYIGIKVSIDNPGLVRIFSLTRLIDIFIRLIDRAKYEDNVLI